MFNNAYAGRKVLLTGHTGFKGSWLASWLLKLGARVEGISLAPSTSPAMFDLLGLEKSLGHHICDVRDANKLKAIVHATTPDVVFHLAAQPLVRLSYADPAETWHTNVMGTVNLLEAVRSCRSIKACVVVTTDKCYENKEWPWGYRENDPMGGHDPYSASKGAAELAVQSYRRSFFHGDACRVASARAGNVIGGGDWSADRIVVDFVKAISSGRQLVLRNPNATRPWQHVLEPLSGYLWLGANLLASEGGRFADAWNFGPSDESVVTVETLAKLLVGAWGSGDLTCAPNATQLHEANLLKLDCSKARAVLGWHGAWDIAATVRHVVEWYKAVDADASLASQLTHAQIEDYSRSAHALRLPWAS